MKQLRERATAKSEPATPRAILAAGGCQGCLPRHPDRPQIAQWKGAAEGVNVGLIYRICIAQHLRVRPVPVTQCIWYMCMRVAERLLSECLLRQPAYLHRHFGPGQPAEEALHCLIERNWNPPTLNVSGDGPATFVHLLQWPWSQIGLQFGYEPSHTPPQWPCGSSLEHALVSSSHVS